MIEIKVSVRGGERSANLAQFLGNRENIFGECRIHFNSPVRQADFWFVSEDMYDDDRYCLVHPSRVFFFSAETSWPAAYYSDDPKRMAYLRQFARVYTCHDVYLESASSALPFLPWMVNANHGPSITRQHPRDIHVLRSMDDLAKPHLLSVFCSTQSITPEHRMRIRFVEAIKSHFGDQLDWYGNGIRPLDEKWEGIAPYQYHLVLENRSAPNIISEKLFDAFLGLSFPIYWGAPNVHEYFDERSLAPINIRDLRGSVQLIDEIISDNTRERALPFIVASRDLVLDRFNVFKRYARLAEADYHERGPLAGLPVCLQSISRHHTIPGGMRGRASRAARRIAYKVQGLQT